jgi:hypothetical protein
MPKSWPSTCDGKGLGSDGAYHTLEENLKKLGFERAENDKGQKLSWRWQARTERGALIVLELLADAPEIAGGKVRPLPTDGKISALNIHPFLALESDQNRRRTVRIPDCASVNTEHIPPWHS